MTDKDKLKQLLTDFGIGFEEKPNVIIIKEGMNKVSGYYGFLATFDFDETGKSLGVGIGEE